MSDHVRKALEAGERSRTDFDTLPDETRQVIMDAVTRDSAAVFAVVVRSLIEQGPDEIAQEARIAITDLQWSKRVAPDKPRHLIANGLRWNRSPEEVIEYLATRLEAIAQPNKTTGLNRQIRLAAEARAAWPESKRRAFDQAAATKKAKDEQHR